MKRTYDLIIPFGSTCACSETLRHANLQHLSLPFDWIGGKDLRVKAERIRDEFSGWFERDTFTLCTVPKFGVATYWCDAWGFTPLHDLNMSQPLDAQLPAVRAKYKRRAERLLRLIAASKRVLAVHIDEPLYPFATAEDAQYLHDVLAKKWPDVQFDVLIIKGERGRAVADRTESAGENWRIVTFDGFRYDEQPQGVLDPVKIGDWLASEYDVIDYRTDVERKMAKRKRRTAHYLKWGASTFWGYCWNKAQYKVYCHIKKRLTQKGVIGNRKI